jgi:hypothetical protein
LNQQQLQWWPKFSRTRRRSRAEIGRFRGREGKRRVGIGCGGVCVLWEGSTGVFIASGGRGQGDQKVASAGVLAAFGGRTGLGGLGGLLGGCRLGCGGLWVGSGASTAVGNVQEEEGLGGGPGRISLLPPTSHGSGRGRGNGARPWHRPGAWLQSSSEQEQCSPQ